MREAVFIPRHITTGNEPCCKKRAHCMEYKKAILTWRVKAGQRVQKGEEICSAEVEKGTAEIPAPYSGRIGTICMPDGEPCAFDDVICYIETDGDVRRG